MMTPLSLPPPSPVAQQHSETLQQHICREIDRQGGTIPFDRFMEQALYAPGLGYYAAGAQKLGETGDFITAPELSSLFGACLATVFRQCRAHLPPDAGIWEIGPGSGKLAKDLLDDLARTHELPPHYTLLEPNADLRERQHHTLANAPVPLQWLDQFPSNFNGLVIANEVLDALPIRRFQITEDGPRWLEVTHHEGVLQYQLGAQANLPFETDHLPLGYRNEFCELFTPWLQSLRDAVNQAVILLIDYGETRPHYYAPTRSDGWLRCYYRHRVHHDPFWSVGLQDITTSVDFSAVMDAAQQAGLVIEEFVNQGRFLMDWQIGPRFETAFRQADARQQVHLAQQMRTLLLPDEMGERFKVLTLTTHPIHWRQ